MTSYLADACALIAFQIAGPVPMKADVREMMVGEDMHVLATTAWEIERKASIGKLTSPVPPGFKGSYADWLRAEGYQLMSLDAEDAVAAAALPDHHKDPMDRFLIAAALRRDWPVITVDAIFRAYGVRTLW